MTGLMNSERGPSIRMPDGSHFYPFDPRAEEINLVNIAHILGQKSRWNGGLKRYYSVAEHSMLVAEIVRPENRLKALLHDAPEALTGFGDVPTPIKRFTSFVSEMEDNIWRVICDSFGLSYEMDADLKRADKIAADIEVRDLTDWQEKPPVDRMYAGIKAEGLLATVAARDYLIVLDNELAARDELRAAQ